MKNRLWTKYFVLLLLEFLALGISGSMLNSPLPMYAKHLGANNSIVGLVTGLFALSSMICRPIFGNLIDSKGRKRILLFGILINATIILSYNWVPNIATFLALRFIQGVGMSAYSTASGTIAADIIPSNRLIEGYGYYGTAQVLANAIGSMIGLAFVASSSYMNLFTVSTLFSISGFILVLFINYESRGKRNNQVYTQKAKVKHRESIFERTALPMAFAVFFVSITTGTVMTFLPSYALSRGIMNIGPYFTVNSLAVLAIRLTSTRLIDKLGLTKVIFLSMFFIGTSMVMLSFSTELYLFITAGIINGFGNGIVTPVMNSLVVKFSPAERKGAANATYYAAIDIGIGVGSVLGGIVSQIAGYFALYLISGLSIVISYIIYHYTIRAKVGNYGKVNTSEVVEKPAF